MRPVRHSKSHCCRERCNDRDLPLVSLFGQRHRYLLLLADDVGMSWLHTDGNARVRDLRYDEFIRGSRRWKEELALPDRTEHTLT